MPNETKTMDSIISDAQKEGIDFSGREDSPASPEATAKPDVTPASSAEPKAITDPSKSVTPQTGEKSVEEQFKDSKLPAHLFPRFKELYNEKKTLSEKVKAQEALLKDPRIVRLLAQGKDAPQEEVKESVKPIPPQGQFTEEQLAAFTQLKSMLGIDQYDSVIKTLQKQNEELSKREENKAFDAEESELKKLSTDYGLDYEQEVYPELSGWLSKNPQFQGLGPGSLKFAFQNVYFSRLGELAERKKNLEMIENQEKLKSGNVEAPNKAPKGKTVKTYKNDDDMIADLVKEAGGLEGIDFSA